MTTLFNTPAMQARNRIPSEKRKSQWVRTLVGGVLFLLGLLMPWKFGFPWQAGLGVSAFGAFTASQQLVRDFIAAVGQFILALMGKSNAG